MSANELNAFLNSFKKPVHLPQDAWNQVLSQSKSVWEAYLNGEDWDKSLDISCKESYLMLVSGDGKLIVRNESLLNYVKTAQVDSWRKQLEEVAFKAIRDRQFDKAERFFTKAIKVDDQSAMNYYRRALIRMRAMRHREALNDMESAIKIRKDLPVFYLKRAQLYRLLDLDFKAMSDLNTAIKLDPEHAEAYEVRAKFRSSLGDRAGGRMDMLKAEELKNKGRLGGTELYEAAA